MPFGPRQRPKRPLYEGSDAGLLASKNFQTFVIASVGHHRQRLSADLFTRLVRHIAQLPTVITNVGHLMGNDQMVLVVDSCLHVVANRSGASAASGVARSAESIAAKYRSMLCSICCMRAFTLP